jgi:hypothetical protein
VGHFCPPGSESTDPIESGSGTLVVGTCLAGWLAGAVPGTAAVAAAGAGAGGAGGQQERPGLGTQPRQEYKPRE